MHLPIIATGAKGLLETLELLDQFNRTSFITKNDKYILFLLFILTFVNFQ